MQASRDDSLASWHKRIRFKIRRGCLENDLLLLNFYDNKKWDSEAERVVFEKLLEQSDQELIYWFQNYSSAPDNFQPIIKKIINEYKISN